MFTLVTWCLFRLQLCLWFRLQRPKTLTGGYATLVSANPKSRPNPQTFISDCRRKGGFMCNKFVDAMIFLEEIQVWWIYLRLFFGAAMSFSLVNLWYNCIPRIILHENLDSTKDILWCRFSKPISDLVLNINLTTINSYCYVYCVGKRSTIWFVFLLMIRSCQSDVKVELMRQLRLWMHK